MLDWMTSPFMNINEAFSNRSICHWSVFPTQSFPLLCSQAALLSPVFCNHHFPNAFYKSPCNFHWKKNGFALSMVVVAWVCWGEGGFWFEDNRKLLLTVWLELLCEQHGALWNKLKIRKECLLICFGPCSRARKSESRGWGGSESQFMPVHSGWDQNAKCKGVQEIPTDCLQAPNSWRGKVLCFWAWLFSLFPLPHSVAREWLQRKVLDQSAWDRGIE